MSSLKIKEGRRLQLKEDVKFSQASESSLVVCIQFLRGEKGKGKLR